MANDSNPRRGPSDATDYSSTKAPETRVEAEERHPHPSDIRLQPGGAHGSPSDPGMSSLDRGQHPTEAANPHQQDVGETRGETQDNIKGGAD